MTFLAWFRHGIAGNHTTHRGPKLGFDNPPIEFRARYLGQQIQLILNGPQDNGGPNEHLQTIRAQGLNVFGEALPPNIVVVDAIPGRLPVKPILQRFGRKPLGERAPEQPPLAWLDGGSAGRCQQQSSEHKTRSNPQMSVGAHMREKLMGVEGGGAAHPPGHITTVLNQ